MLILTDSVAGDFFQEMMLRYDQTNKDILRFGRKKPEARSFGASVFAETANRTTGSHADRRATSQFAEIDRRLMIGSRTAKRRLGDSPANSRNSENR